MDTGQGAVPNHHAHYPGFAGLRGYLAAGKMLVRRGGNARLAERLGGLGPGDTLADVGCGPGAAVRHAGRRGATVFGVDPAPVMLRVARLVTRPSPRVQFVEGTAESLPLADGSLDLLWSIASVHHWADLDAALREARRVLSPGGRLVVIERQASPGAVGHASHGWTDAQAAAFAERCHAHGFEDLRTSRQGSGRRATVSVTATIRGGATAGEETTGTRSR